MVDCSLAVKRWLAIAVQCAIVLFPGSGGRAESIVSPAPQIRLVGRGVEIAWKTPAPTAQARVYWTDLLSTQIIPSVFPAYSQAIALPGEGRRHSIVLPVASAAVAGAHERKPAPLPLGRTIHYRVSCVARTEGKTREWRSADFQFRLVRSTKGGVSLGLSFVEPPAVSSILGNRAIIAWQTNRPAKARLYCWDATKRPGGDVRPQAVRAIRNDQPARAFRIAVKGLEPGHVYDYEVVGLAPNGRDLVRSPRGRFRASVRPGAPFRFAVLSGSQGDPSRGDPDHDIEGVNMATLGRLVRSAAQHDPHFVLFPGNLIGGEAPTLAAASRRYRAWKQAVQSVRAYIPFYACMGNGEATSPHRAATDEKQGVLFAEDAWRRAFGFPGNAPLPLRHRPPYLGNVYSFDYGDCHFVCLNSNYRQLRRTDPDDAWSHTIDPRQQEWLARDLVANSDKTIFVFFHEPVYPTGSGAGRALDRRTPNRNRVWQMLDKAGVAAVFSGQTGHYSRLRVDKRIRPDSTRTVWQIVCGRAGGPGFPKDDRLPGVAALDAYGEGDHYALVEVRGPQCEIRAWDSDGRLLDECTIRLRR